jgi:cytoplasmic tRNA 2-thiolation protein 2
MKPMKEISLKEAAIYAHLRKLPTVNERRWVDGRSSGGRGKGSTNIEMLTEREYFCLKTSTECPDFVLGLSVTHPATVSTINKTGDKLVFPGNILSTDVCPLCQM